MFGGNFTYHYQQPCCCKLQVGIMTFFLMCGSSMDIPATIMILITIFCVWNPGDMYQKEHGFKGCPRLHCNNFYVISLWSVRFRNNSIYWTRWSLSHSSHLLMPCFFSCITAFISHSSSLLQLKFIFEAALPTLHDSFNNSCLVDVGSRLGAVLYGVSFFLRLCNSRTLITQLTYCWCARRNQINVTG